MNLITNNPYRIIGIAANASAKEIQARKGRIQAYAKVGKQITSEFDFSFLQTIHRDNTIIEKALSNIEQNQNKVVHSLFWFTNLNTVDNTAIQHLITGNKEKAIEIWDKLTDDKEVTSKNFSAFNNIGTLYLLEDSKEEVKQGITAKIKLIESESFQDFVHTVADETFSIDKNRQIEIFIDELLTQFKQKYSTAETMELFSNCNGTTQKYLSKKFTEEPIHKIETQIEQCTKKRANDKSNAYRFGIDLHNNVKKDLSFLKSILGLSNLQYKMLADSVAKEILQCSVDYFNESQNQGKTSNYLQEAMNLAEIADKVSATTATKDKTKKNIATLVEMKDRELSQAIDVLKSIKKAFQTNEAKITKNVLEMPMGYNQSINWTKVNQMIANSLDWNKVVELIKETIPLSNIEKIKLSDKQAKIAEYKLLVDFIFSKLNSYQKNQVKYICYWKTINTTSPPKPITPAPIGEKSWSQENPGCFIALIIVGVILLISIFSFTLNPHNSNDYKFEDKSNDTYNKTDYNSSVNINEDSDSSEDEGVSVDTNGGNDENYIDYGNEMDDDQYQNLEENNSDNDE